MSVRMTATKAFTNPRITGPRADGAVLPGEGFATDWVHGGELRRLGLAAPEDATAFDAEPVEMLQPHNQISEPELRGVNARRSAARAIGAGAATAVPTGTGTGPGVVVPPAAAPAALTTATTGSGAKSNAPAIPPAPGAAG